MDPNAILVIGAGVAGLSAARTLAEAGRSVTLLEASPRVGGRIHTIHTTSASGPEAIELGAEFIHGQPPELWALIKEAGLETYELDGPSLEFADGSLQPRDDDSTAEAEAGSVLDPLESLPRPTTSPETAPDLTFAEYLDQHPEIPADLRRTSIGYVEGFNAADHRVISSVSLGLQQAAEDAIAGDRLFRIRDGYDSLPTYLLHKFTAAGGTVHLSTRVERIEWTHHKVTVTADQAGARIAFQAAEAIIALPLGVLQSNAVLFAPIPPPVQQAQRLRMGQVRRFTLLFREKFWTSAAKEPPAQIERYGSAQPPSVPAIPGDLPRQSGEFSFLMSFNSVPPVWWTPLPHPSHTITGWVGGPRSEALFALTPDQLGQLACQTLAEIFHLRTEHVISLLLETHSHPWHSDPLSLGAYSYIPSGALDAPARMTIPAEQTLFFAGEHTDTTGHWGTVHAALRSGLRAAHQVLFP